MYLHLNKRIWERTLPLSNIIHLFVVLNCTDVCIEKTENKWLRNFFLFQKEPKVTKYLEKAFIASVPVCRLVLLLLLLLLLLLAHERKFQCRFKRLKGEQMVKPNALQLPHKSRKIERPTYLPFQISRNSLHTLWPTLKT